MERRTFITSFSLVILILMFLVTFVYTETETAGVADIAGSTVESTSPITVTWASRAPMLTPRSGLALVASADGKLYAIGGEGSTWNALSSVEMYDPDSNTWTAKASMPTARSWLAVAAASNGKIYAIGGKNALGDPVATVEEYDPATDTWTAKVSMAVARRDLTAVAANGKVYAIGGYAGGPNYYAIVEEYDPATDSWRFVLSMSTARQNPAAVLGPNGLIYVIGGQLGNALGSVEAYDPSSNTWSGKSGTGAFWSLGAALGPNGRIYTAGGVNSEGFTSNVAEYDPLTDTWTAKTSMPTRRAGLGLATSANGRIYAVGGSQGSNAILATVEEASITTISAETATATPTASATDSATATEAPPTATATVTATPAASSTGTATSTDTFTPLRSFLPLVLKAPPPTLTGTPTETPVPTSIPVPTSTASATPTMCSGMVQLVQSPSFEDWMGRPPGWTSADGSVFTTHKAYLGDRSAELGGSNNYSNVIWQWVYVPTWAETGALYFTYWMDITRSIYDNYPPEDFFYVGVYSGGLALAEKQLDEYHNGPTFGWVSLRLDMPNITAYRGQSVLVSMIGTTDSTYPTTLYVDDVRVQVACGVPAVKDEGPAP